MANHPERHDDRDLAICLHQEEQIDQFSDILDRLNDIVDVLHDIHEALGEVGV